MHCLERIKEMQRKAEEKEKEEMKEIIKIAGVQRRPICEEEEKCE